MVNETGAPGLGEELCAEPDQPARGHQVLHPDPAGSVVDHLLHASLAHRQHLRDHPHVLLGHVDAHPLDRLAQSPVDLSGDDLGVADRQFEPLAAHQLDQYRERQLATALDLPDLGAIGLENPERDIPDELAIEPVLDLAGGQLVAVLPGQGRGVDPDRDRQRRLVHRDHW